MEFCPKVTVPTLYHAQWFCSSIPHQILLELDVPASSCAVVKLSEEVRKAADFSKLSPRRVLPVLALPSGEKIVEAGAIALYFLETFDKAGKLHPLIGSPDRPRFLQAAFYVTSEMYKASVSLFLYCMKTPKEKRDTAVLGPMIETFNKVVIDHLERELDFGKRKFYLGDEFSSADIFLGYITMTTSFVQGEDLLTNTVVADYAKRVAERSSFKALFDPSFAASE